LSADLPLPSEIYIHEYLTVDGQKMSKTIGNVIYPRDLVKKYGADGARYLLLSALPYTSDGDITWERMDQKFNADLANGLGNLINRTLVMIQKYDLKSQIRRCHFDQSGEIFEKIPRLPRSIEVARDDRKKQDQGDNQEFLKLIEERKFELALKEIWKGIKEQNQYIDKEKPWELAKNNPEKLAEVLLNVHSFLSSLALQLSPFMPETAEKMKNQLETLKPEALFPRI
jgi:methionyl-tRNA synthetase